MVSVRKIKDFLVGKQLFADAFHHVRHFYENLSSCETVQLVQFLKIVSLFIVMISERALDPPADHVQTLQVWHMRCDF